MFAAVGILLTMVRNTTNNARRTAGVNVSNQKIITCGGSPVPVQLVVPERVPPCLLVLVQEFQPRKFVQVFQGCLHAALARIRCQFTTCIYEVKRETNKTSNTTRTRLQYSLCVLLTHCSQLLGLHSPLVLLVGQVSLHHPRGLLQEQWMLRSRNWISLWNRLHKARAFVRLEDFTLVWPLHMRRL